MRTETIELSGGHVHLIAYRSGEVELRMRGNFLRMTQNDYRDFARALSNTATLAQAWKDEDEDAS